MNINAQQYNAVVEGLRTQLELQRALTREKINIIASLTEQVNTSRKLRDSDTDLLQSADKSIGILVERNACLAAIARGDQMPACSCATEPQIVAALEHQNATRALIVDLEEALADRRDKLTTANTVLRTELNIAAHLANGNPIPSQFEWQNIPALVSIRDAREALLAHISVLEGSIKKRRTK